jgi:hypothetical protein
LTEGSAGDCVLDDIQMEDAVEGEGWEERVLGSPKLKFVTRSTFAVLRPCILSPQRQPVEVAFVGEDQLFGAVVNIDVPLEFLSILLVLLHSRPCDLQQLGGQ